MHPELDIVVTDLEQFCPLKPLESVPLPYVFIDRVERELTLAHWQNPSVADYRDLYRRVGARFLWWERLLLPQEDLLDLICAENTSIYTVNHNNRPVGYAEIVRETAPATANIAYFGLVEGYTEMGIGRALMRQILAMLWQTSEISRITLNTCTLDHPKALGFYQHMGFLPVGKRSLTIRDPRSLPELQGVYD